MVQCFFSQQISEQYFSAWLFSETNRVASREVSCPPNPYTGPSVAELGFSKLGISNIKDLNTKLYVIR